MSGLADRNLLVDTIKDGKVREILRDAFENTQDRQMSKLTSVPTVKDIDERELKTFESGDNKRLQTKQSDTIVSFLGAIADTTEAGDVLTLKDVTDGTLRYLYIESGTLKVADTKP